MSQKTTFVLLALLALAVGYLFCWRFDYLGLGTRPPAPTLLGKPLLEKPPANVEDIVRVELDREGKPKVLAENKGKHWALVEPIQQTADRGKIDDLLQAFKGLTVAAAYDSKGPDAVSPELGGLDKPRAVLVLTDKSNKQYRLAVGARDSQGRTYVQVDADPKVYAVAEDIAAKLAVDAAQLRTRDIWDVTRDQIRKLTLTSEKGQLALEDQKGTWVITAPIKAAADANAVSTLLGGVAGLRADKWVSDDAGTGAVYGLNNPTLTVELNVETKSAVTQPEVKPAEYADLKLTFGLDVRDQTFARLSNQPAVFAVSTATAKKLDVGLDDLRDKRLVPIAKADVVGVVLAGPKGPADLIKDAKNAWQMTAPVKSAADGEAIDKLLDKLADLKAGSFEDKPGPLALAAVANPQLRVTLNQGKDKPAVTLVIGQPSATGAMVYVQNPAYPSLAVVRADDLKDVLIDPMALADKAVWSLTEDRIKRVSRTGKGDARTIERVANDWQKWELVKPTVMDADGDAVRGLLDRFKDLKAVKRTLLKPGEVGLNKPTVTVVFTVLETPAPATQPAAKAATQPAEVEVNRSLALAQKDTTLYGQVNGAGPVYELNSALMDDATREWARRTLVGKLEADKAASVSLDSSVGKVELIHGGEDWKLKTDSTVPLDKARVEEVINNISGLLVTRYVAFDSKDLARFGLDKPATTVIVRWPAATTGPEAGQGKQVELLVSAKGEDGGSYVTAGDGKIGLVSPVELLKVQKDWKFFEKAKEAAPAATPSMPPGMGGMGGMPPGMGGMGD